MIFDAITTAMPCDGHSLTKKDANEHKAVTILYMLMFSQSQKANWFKTYLSSQAVLRGISDTGL